MVVQYTDDLIPDMTSNTEPSGVCTRTDVLNSGTEAWYAFDNNWSDYWHSTNAAYPKYLGYQFTFPVVAAKYTIASRSASPAVLYPKDWKFQGSNNGSSWTDLHSVSGASFSASEKKTYTFNNANAYSYYRWYFTAGAENYLAIAECEIMAIKKPKSGLAIGNPWIFLKDAYDRHDKLWTQKRLILPKDLGFEY